MHAKDSLRQLERQQGWAADPRWAQALLPATILAATFLAYVPTLALGFVFDDHVLIVTNDSIRSWRYFPSYFTSHIWTFRYPHLLSNAYRPLFLIWLRLNDVLFHQHAWGWHFSLVLAHVAVTYLVYQLCIRLTRDTWSAAAGALIFGLHPVHVETIAESAWADQPLSTLFMLAAMLAFIRSREPAPGLDDGLAAAGPCHKGWLAASMALTAAALLSKESAMVLPILIGGYAWIYGGNRGREVAPVEGRVPVLDRLSFALISSIPFWAVVLLYVPLRIRALKGFAHVVTPLSFSQQVFTIPTVLLFYLRLLVWPVGLSCYYDTHYISTASWHDFVLPAALLAAVVVGLALWYVRTRQSAPEEAKAIAFACLWMMLTLLPVLNFRLLPESEIAHDRYVYLPSVGFVILVAVALRQAMGAAAGSFRRPAWVLLAVLVLSLGYATARQSLFWSDDLTLNSRAHDIAPHNVSATTSLAAAVAQHGMDGTAMALYRQALAVQPEFWRANVNLAYLYFAHGNLPEAARFFARACAADPTDGDQFLYLGMTLLRLGRFAEAEQAVRTALVARPLGKNYHLGLGMVLRQEGRLPEARQEIAAELAEDAQNAQARTLLEEVTRQMSAQADNPSGEEGARGHWPHIK
jgi:tetratricopeptide (TPR) repeat protein